MSNILNSPRPIRGDIPIMVGGSGERKTLRLVAKYADACNVFGDVEKVKHLFGVLDGHCQDVGRDPAEITRTRMARIFIDSDDAAAQQAFDDAGLPERLASMALVGGPERIGAGVQELLDAGVEGLTVVLSDVHDLEKVRLTGETIGPLLGSPATT